MRGLTACLLSVAVASGASCTTRQKIAGGGAGVAIIGVGLTFSTEGRTEEEVGTSGKVGIAMMLTGLVTLFIAAALEETEAEAKPKEIRVATTPTEISREEQQAQVAAQKKRDQAWALTKQAQEAARANNCAKVTELSAQVGALDPGFYSEVFMTDVAVQQCFLPKDTPPAPAATQPFPSPTVTP